ncbi:hypothetical protein [Rufibacter latericius]|uniref:hypothetical protein n=1 Tax=Rufibacter latericius TaxID=2487040 RepID=UPI00140221C2|nr:hypothetical protein [Rufibacter latericius]
MGGPFYIVTIDERDKYFVVNARNNTEILTYNINANYICRRKIADGKVLKGKSCCAART